MTVSPSTGGAAAGSTYYPIQFANTSGSSCTLYGYPGVSFVTAQGGSQIGPAASRNPAMPKALVTLAPGQTVHAELQVVDAENYPPALRAGHRALAEDLPAQPDRAGVCQLLRPDLLEGQAGPDRADRADRRLGHVAGHSNRSLLRTGAHHPGRETCDPGQAVACAGMDDLTPRLRSVCDLSVAEVREFSGRHEYDGMIQDLSLDGVRAGVARMAQTAADGERLEDPHDEAHLAAFEDATRVWLGDEEMHRAIRSCTWAASSWPATTASTHLSRSGTRPAPPIWPGGRKRSTRRSRVSTGSARRSPTPWPER